MSESPAVPPPPPPAPPGSRPLTLFGIPFNRRLRTGEQEVPWGSVFILSLLWFTFGFHIFAGGQALTFTIQRYNRDPRIISLITTITSILMLGSFISYLSDQIWTRVGRRRPFLIVAWASGAASMWAFGYFAEISAVCNRVLGWMGIPHLPEIVLLGIVVGCYKILMANMAPLEPLLLECVPPRQRGRFWGIRGMVFTISVLFFFQVLWPVFDLPVDLFGYLGFPGLLIVTGERLVYTLAGALFFLTGLYLVFGVEETFVPTAPNRRLREMFLGEKRAAESPVPVAAPAAPENRPAAGGRAALGRVWAGLSRVPIVGFLTSFFSSIFLDWRHYAFYIILVIPGLEIAVWGSYNPMMQNDQFGYTKANQALWALPIGLLSVFLLTPFAGWYSDVRLRVRWWQRIVLLVISAMAASAVFWMYQRYQPADIRELPTLWVICLMTFLTAVAIISFYVPLVETLLDKVGREHARAWVALLTILKGMVNVVLLYLWIRTWPDHVPSILGWMLFGVVSSTFGALVDTFVGPMIFEYMPRSRMGTINSGAGIYKTVLEFLVANLGAWWVVFYSAHFVHQPESGPMHYDFTSMYLLQFCFFVPAIAAKVYFLRQVVTGRILKWGVIEVEGAAPPAAPAKGHS